MEEWRELAGGGDVGDFFFFWTWRWGWRWGVWVGVMCSDGRSRLWAPSCHRHPVASSPLIWEKNT